MRCLGALGQTGGRDGDMVGSRGRVKVLLKCVPPREMSMRMEKFNN